MPSAAAPVTTARRPGRMCNTRDIVHSVSLFLCALIPAFPPISLTSHLSSDFSGAVVSAHLTTGPPVHWGAPRQPSSA